MGNHEDEYIPMLESAFHFLFRKKKKMKGSSLNQSYHEYVIANGGQCLHCGVKLSKKNSNTEHIQDLALGGDNKAGNKVIMCKSCNSARNVTMQEYLGTPSYWRGFPGNWDRVKKYLLWNAVTVDYGHNSGKIYAEVHQIFESNMEQNNTRHSPPEFWYGRGDQSRVNRSMNSGNRGLIVRFFDWFFGYNDKAELPNLTINIDNNGSNQNEHNQSHSSNVNQSYPDVGGEFYIYILDFAKNIVGELKVATFCNLFKDYLEENHIQSQSFREFAHSFGIPKRRSIVDIVGHYFSDTISCRLDTDGEIYVSYNSTEEE